MSTYAAPPPSELSCPHCSASRVVRWGWVRTVRAPARRRFRCKVCGRTFSEHTGRALAGSWYPDRWSHLCQELVRQTSVRQTARRLGVSPSTAFRWRHRALQALADHRERTGRRRLGSGGLEGPTSGGADGDDGDGDRSRGAGRGVVGVMGVPFKVTRRRGPALEPPRFFRVLVAADAAGRVAMERDVPGEIVGPPGSPLPLWDWVWSGRARARFPLRPPDQVPSPRRLLDRWCAPGCELRWVGCPFYQWGKVAAQLGMTAEKWTPRWGTSDLSETEPAVRARDLAVKLRYWLRRYRGVSTRWLRGYLALFAQLYEKRTVFPYSFPAHGARGADHRRKETLWADEHPVRVAGRPRSRRKWPGLRRSRQQYLTALAWRLIEISARGAEGPVARSRRCWIR